MQWLNLIFGQQEFFFSKPAMQDIFVPCHISIGFFFLRKGQSKFLLKCVIFTKSIYIEIVAIVVISPDMELQSLKS